jgi:hypothetical protein
VVSRARRTLKHVIDNRCGLVDPANPCRCERQVTASLQAGILRPDHLPLASHAREKVRVWIEPYAKQLDEVAAIGDLYRFDRFAAPAAFVGGITAWKRSHWSTPGSSWACRLSIPSRSAQSIGGQGLAQPRPRY